MCKFVKDPHVRSSYLDFGRFFNMLCLDSSVDHLPVWKKYASSSFKKRWQQIWCQLGAAKTGENGEKLQQTLAHPTLLPSNRKSAHFERRMKYRWWTSAHPSNYRNSTSCDRANECPAWHVPEPSVLPALTNDWEQEHVSERNNPRLVKSRGANAARRWKWQEVVFSSGRLCQTQKCVFMATERNQSTTCWGHWWLRACDVLKNRRLRSDVRKACAAQQTAVVSSSQKAPSMCGAMHRNQSWETMQERHLAISSVVTRQDAMWTSFENRMHSQEHGTGSHRRHKNHARVGDQKNVCWCCAGFGSSFVWRLEITRRCCCKAWCPARSARIDAKTTACAGCERTAHRAESTRRCDEATVKWKHPRSGTCAENDSSSRRDATCRRAVAAPSRYRHHRRRVLESAWALREHRGALSACLDCKHQYDTLGAARNVQETLSTTYRIPQAHHMLWRATESAWSRSASSRGALACQKKPRSIEELGGSLRLEHSSFFDTVRSRSGECSTVNGTGDERILRLICFRFDVGHISLPLGAKNLEAYSNERERTAPEERGGWRRRCCSVNVRRARGCTCCWLQTTSVHWSERAQQWRSRASCWRGHWRVLVLRWTYLKCRKMKKCGGPSLMTELVLVKKRYVWRLQRCRTSQQRMCWGCAEARRSSGMSASRRRIPRLDESRPALSLTVWRIQRVSLMNLLGDP